RIDALNKLSLALSRDNSDSSMSLAIQTIALSKQLDYQKGIADGYFNLGNFYLFSDSLKPMMLNHLNALRIYEQIEPCIEMEIVLTALSKVNRNIGRNNKAKEYTKKTIHTAQILSDHQYEIMSWTELGVICYYNEELDSAFYYYEKAAELLKLYPDGYNHSTVIFMKGLYYGRKHGNEREKGIENSEDLTMAISMFIKSNEIDKVLLANNKITIDLAAEGINNLGVSYIETGTKENIEKGSALVKKAQSMIDSSCISIWMKIQTNNRLASIERDRGNYKSAIVLLKNGLLQADKCMEHFSMKNYRDPHLGFVAKYYIKLNKNVAYWLLYDSYRELGDYKTALEYYILTRKSADEIFEEDNKKLVAFLEAESENERTEKQIALLEKENEVKSLSINQSRTYLFALTGFLITLFLFTLLYYRQRKIRIEHNTLIREQKLLHDLEIKDVESEKLKELDHMKSQFFANISHEFRTPLTLILGPLEKLFSKSTNRDDKKDLSLAKKYTQKLQTLINNLLTISKLESGKMQLHASETDLVMLVRTYLQAFESLANQCNITLKFLSEKEEIRAFVDREKFEQVLNNLFSNAIKFSGKDGTIEVSISTFDQGNKVRISIYDTGCGISPEHTNHIFDRFYQVEHEDNSYYEGSGIGLALAKELVELHYGQINVESQKGEGSTFTIVLPIGKEHLKHEQIVVDKQEEISSPEISTTIPKADEECNSAAESNNGLPILLIVEDNSDMRFYIREYFENEYQIIEAVDGLDGYEKATDQIPDIIISDVMMPGMDGNEFLRKVKLDQRTSHIPVILLTARASSEDKIEGLETGADDFITKPFDGKELQVRVKNLIEQRERTRKILEEKIQSSNSVIHIDFADSGITSMDEQFLKKVFENVRLHHAKSEFNAKDLGEAIGLSVSQLYRKIKALTGQTTVEFIRTFRLTRAAELLNKKSATIAEIAYEVGFSSPSYFAECFRMHFGKLPSEYAENVTND
ncbi:MAG: hypothetical protein DRI54_02910, partial [Bacteroidetes bacterium]